jgi:carbon storage regulator
MLVLTRQIGEEIVIGENIRIVLLRIKGKQARIGIDAPPEVQVDRSEVKQRRSESVCRPQGAREMALVS